MDKQDYINQYNKNHYTQFIIRFRKDTEIDLINHIDNIQGSKTAYIKQLIIEDMKRGK